MREIFGAMDFWGQGYLLRVNFWAQEFLGLEICGLRNFWGRDFWVDGFLGLAIPLFLVQGICGARVCWVLVFLG